MRFDQFSAFDTSVYSSEAVDGNMGLADSSGLENLQKFLDKSSINKKAVYCQQTHGNKIEIVENAGMVSGVDGVLTRQDFALVIRSADCVPVLIASKSGLIGAVHCGRKSLTSGIISTSLKSALARLDEDPAELHIFLAPHIRTRNYEIGEEVIATLGEKFSAFLSEMDGKACFDLTSAAISELEEIGILADNIIDSGLDTYEDERFFSARQERAKILHTFVSIICKNGN